MQKSGPARGLVVSASASGAGRSRFRL